MPTHTAADPCEGKVFSVEQHHKRVEKASTGDNVGLNIKGLKKDRMPRVGDVMILKSDGSLRPCKNFTAQVQTLDIPSEVKVGYSPIGFVRCGRSACKITKFNWKVCLFIVFRVIFAYFSFIRLARRLVARSLPTLTPSRPTRLPRLSSSLSSPWSSTPSPSARVFPALPSLTATTLSCLARLSPLSPIRFSPSYAFCAL